MSVWEMNATGLTDDENAQAFGLMCAFNASEGASARARNLKEKALATILELGAEVDAANREADEAFDVLCQLENKTSDRARDAVRKVA